MSIAENLARLQAELAEAAHHAGRSPQEIALMAVSKQHPVSCLQEAYAAGQRLFGENRVQEWQGKSTEPAPDGTLTAQLPGLEMHLIGPLQSNKTARAAELFHAIQTVDSAKLAQRLHSAAEALGKTLPVWLEIKLSPEESKHGLAPEDLPTLLEALAPLTHLRPVGLMSVAPWPSDLARANEEARPTFARLRELRDEAQRQIPTCTGLSMGMSNDFRAAIAEGSTLIRIGTALFGSRAHPTESA